MTVDDPMSEETVLAPAQPWWRLIAAQSWWETRLALSHGEQLLLTIILPALMLVGFTQSTVVDLPIPVGADRVDVVAPGVLALALLSSSFTGQAIAAGFDRRAGVLLFLATTPLGRAGFIGGRIAATLSVQAVQCAVLVAIALLLGWSPPIAGLGAGLGIAVVGSVTLSALGLALAGLVRAEAVLAGANLLWVLWAGLGVVLPVSTLPGWLQPVALWCPATALAQGLRTASLGGAVPVLSLVVLVVWLVGGLMATRGFRWHP